MKARNLAFLLVVAVVLGVPNRATLAASVDVRISITVFHEPLAAYGTWVSNRYGQVWVPRRVATSWRPYTDGYWVNTDQGWLWVSDEPWAWASYHYGRWYRDPHYGWVWVPGTVWGPAWVAWRSSDAYVGWAPLPPSVTVVSGLIDPPIDPISFAFVPIQRFTERDVGRYVEPVDRNTVYVRSTVNTTRYSVGQARVVNQGVPLSRVERAAGHALPQLAVQASSQPGAARVESSRVTIYRPSAGPGGPPRSVAAPNRQQGRPVVAPNRDAAAPNRGAAAPERVHGPAAVRAPRGAPAAPPAATQPAKAAPREVHGRDAAPPPPHARAAAPPSGGRGQPPQKGEPPQKGDEGKRGEKRGK